MNLKKIFTIIVTSLSLATIGTTLYNVTTSKTTASAKKLNVTLHLKKKLPSQFKTTGSWLSSSKPSTSSDESKVTKKRYMIKTPGNNLKLGLAYFDENGQFVSKQTTASGKFKYSQHIAKDTYLLSTTNNGKKNLIEIKFVNYNKLYQRYIILKGKRINMQEYRFNRVGTEEQLNQALKHNDNNNHSETVNVND